MKVDSRPDPLVDPLDPDDEDGHPLVEDDDPEPKKPVTKRRKKKESSDTHIQRGTD